MDETVIAWLTKIYSNDGMLLDTRLDFVKPSIRSAAKTEFVPLFDKPAPETNVERDFPAEFEAWWETYRHRNREPSDYSVKKQIAFDAFYFAARNPAPQSTVAVPRDRILKLLEYADSDYVPNSLFAEFSKYLDSTT